MTIQTKKCTKCKEIKSVAEFYKCSSHKTGYKSQCIKCLKEYTHSDRGREVARMHTAKFRQTERGKEYTKQYNQTEKAKAMKRAYKKTEAGQESERRYMRSEKRRRRAKEYRKLHPYKPVNVNYLTEEKRARRTVWYAVYSGKLPRVHTLQCSHCDNRAEHYHHHKGYAKEVRLDVIPLCAVCHARVHHP